VLLTALLVLAGVLAVVVPPAAGELDDLDDLDDLDVTISGGVEVVQRWLSDGVLGFSGDQVATWLEQVERQVRDNAGNLARGAVTGATLVAEVLVGLSLAVVLLFFLLKDGEEIWAWLRDLFPARHRTDVHTIARACGRRSAGTCAASRWSRCVGPVGAIVVALAVLIVRQVESNFFQPVVVGRSVRVHPIGILLGVTAGAVLAGIVGAIVATPAVAVSAPVLRYLRFERQDAPETGEPAAG
jgi:predicted PurR-regulated permease PerM